MADDYFPIDFSHPAVREYMSLIRRLQVLTPLSLLANIVTVAVCSFVVHPSLGDITRWHPASISPSVPVVAFYILAIYVLQVGYCLLLVIVTKTETKKTVVKGVGHALVFSNWIMAAWAISWTLQWWIPSTALLGIQALALLYANMVLIIYHEPTFARPLDIVFIHAPMRLLFILTVGLLFPYSLLITLGHGQSPAHHDNYQWEGFAVMISVNLVGLFIIAARRDIVWAAGATWVDVAVWSSEHKPAPVFVTAVIFTVFHPLTLLMATVWVTCLKSRSQGRIRLPPDEEPGRPHAQAGGRAHNGEIQSDWS
ncbi:hypothetical protein K488DRAFT_51946 [Vararia minispora EC-137]|uniref:Uncharacterized protein n=1 Tax=Vararia minispora EC-137 TaxID=1314806 RepID=A0ACB8QIQ2_9AGAM|nr:hypothetical protein K488DRAFT_51946 [Vararia minispora EC-137]